MDVHQAHFQIMLNVIIAQPTVSPAIHLKSAHSVILLIIYMNNNVILSVLRAISRTEVHVPLAVLTVYNAIVKLSVLNAILIIT